MQVRQNRTITFLSAMTLFVLLAFTVQGYSQKYTTFNVPGDGPGAQQGTMAIGVNTRGSVVGQYMDSNGACHVFLRKPTGKFMKFDPPGAVNAWAFGLNDKDTIAGYYADTVGVYHGFLRTSDGTLTAFDAPGAGTLTAWDAGTSKVVEHSVNAFRARAPDGIYLSISYAGPAPAMALVPGIYRESLPAM